MELTKDKKKNVLKQKSGVTLLVLVVIIILFLIILSITLPPIVTNNGIISNTKTSEYEKQEVDGILKVLSFEILTNNNISELTNNTFKTKLEQKLFKYNEDKEERGKVKIVITAVQYDISKSIVITYTKDGKSYRTIIERY